MTLYQFLHHFNLFNSLMMRFKTDKCNQIDYYFLCLFDSMDCAFSPDDKMVVTSQAVRKGEDGKLVFLDRENFDIITEMNCGPAVSYHSLFYQDNITRCKC